MRKVVNRRKSRSKKLELRRLKISLKRKIKLASKGDVEALEQLREAYRSDEDAKRIIHSVLAVRGSGPLGGVFSRENMPRMSGSMSGGLPGLGKRR